MPEELAPNLYRIEVPLPNNPLRSINCYVLKSDDRNLVVDSGMNREECRTVLEAGFNELELDLTKTDFFITHIHSDHSGLVGVFATDTSKVYFNEIESEFFKKPRGEGFGGRMGESARLGGFPEEELKQSMTNHPGAKFGMPVIPEFTILRDGDTLIAGGRTLEVIATPGHSPGHLCLYDRENRIFLAGDHVLGDITPNIASYGETDNALGDYLDSLGKVFELDVVLTLPGHRSMIDDFRGRIDEIRHHHGERCEEVIEILNDGGQTGYQVASRMTWDVRADTWADVPIMQKWFATGEAISHLRYLEAKGDITSRLKDEFTHYTLA